MLGLLWQNSRKRFSGTGYWFADLLLQTFGVLLIGLRGMAPDLITVVFANFLTILGAVLAFIGISRFLGYRISLLFPLFVLVAFTVVQFYFTYVQPNLAVRLVNHAVAVMLLSGLCAWLLLLKASPTQRNMTKAPGVVFVLFTLFSLSRILQQGFFPEQTLDFMHASVWNAIVLIAYQALSILLAYSLLIMINQHLFMDLQKQEEKFFKAFHSTAEAILLTRLQDGKIFDVNSTFERLSGYSASEAIGKTTTELNIWTSAEHRDTFANALRRDGRVRGMVFPFRVKSGGTIIGEISAEVITINDVDTIIACITDITDKKHSEEQLSASLRESDRLRKQAENLVEEKNLILREVHHRIKNNMNTVQSMLSIQGMMLNDQKASEALENAATRVRSMSFLYDKLYRSSSLTEGSVRDYLPPLIHEIIGIFQPLVKIKLELNLEDIVVSARVLSLLGIILNELLVNAIKHAFPGRQEGLIRITIHRSGELVTLVFSDDGVGLPESFSIENASGFGMQLVSILVEQMKGTIRYERGIGTSFIITLML
ncbi:MAG: PAS domain S-box protein [Spirochaetes bacterium]|nr:PAS domain S-box protein [Spirochaetota bacterium]